MTRYYRDNFGHMVIFDIPKISMKKRVMDFLAKERNANTLNAVAGLIGIIGGLWFLLGGF